MSFNLRSAFSIDGRDSWPFRARLVRDLLSRHRPGVIGFQEAWPPVRRGLGRALPSHACRWGAATGTRLVFVGNPLFCDREIVSDGTFWLGPTPHLWSRGWDSRSVRAATWPKILSASRPLVIVNAHFDHVGKNARLASAQLVIEKLRALDWPRTPAIVLGDFNAEAGSDVQRIFLETGFRDSFVAADHADDASAYTSHGFTGRPRPDGRRIDWTLFDDALRVTRCDRQRRRTTRYPSDHFPVLAEFVWA